LRILSEYEEHRLKTNIKEGKGIYLMNTVFAIEEFDTSLKELTETVKLNSELISTMPTSQDMPDDSIGFNLLVGSSMPLEELEKTVKFNVNTLVEAKPVQVKKAEEPVQELSLKTTTSIIRVDIEKLDRILNTVGELNLARDAAKRIWAEMVESYGHAPLIVDFYKITQALQRRVSEMQERVLEIRMVPIGQIFGRLSQVIRRYTREVGKEVDLSIFGAETEIDKYLAEEIIDPLVHVIRNAIDHGIEPGDERKAKGKKRKGSIALRAYQKGNHVVIEVNDDGKGLNIEKIRQKAIEKGLIEPGMEMQEKEIVEFIFMPGFSTRDIVSEVSGRGVGTDIVKEKLSAIGGLVDVETEKNVGTTFILTLPITLAIIKALIVRVGTERFAVPLSSVSETLTVEHSEFQSIENRRVYNLRGEMLPMENLNEILRIQGDETDRSFVVVSGIGDRRIGLLVDELVGQHEVVIKSFGNYFEGLKGFAGAAEIGKHEVILVLDVESIIDETTRKGALHV
jgi:two-component system chemotaxis sensor kinase CheA